MARLYFFDLKGEIRRRDHTGRQFADPTDAIRHSEIEARRLVSSNPQLVATDCYLAVIEENGCEIHRAPLYSLARRAAA